MTAKIIYTASSLSRTGPTNQLLHLIKGLDRSRFHPMVLTLSPEVPDSRWPDFQAEGVELLSLELSRLSFIFWGRSALKAKIRELSPALIHSHGLRADLLTALSGNKLPKISTAHNYPQIDYPMSYGTITGKWMTWVQIETWKRFDAVVGVSESVQNNIQDHYGLSNICNIANGVDTSLFKPTSKNNKIRLRSALGIAESKRTWITAGTLSERKGILRLLQSWHETLGRDNENQLLVLGDGPLRDLCEGVAAQSRNVVFLGQRDNVADYLATSDLYVSASAAEGLPMAVIEAMACGLPVVLSDIGPHRELYTADPAIGALFCRDDANALPALLLQFATADLEAHSLAAERIARGRFSAKTMATHYQSLYDRLLERDAK